MRTLSRESSDLAATTYSSGTDAATYAKWKWDCLPSRKAADKCDALYFTGTSAATAHTGGLAALIVQWLKEVGADCTVADVANFLRQSAVDIPPTGLDQDSGRGFVSMPVRPPQKGWEVHSLLGKLEQRRLHLRKAAGIEG